MMRTLPDIIKHYARRDAPFIYTLDIEPAAGDSWSTKRYATAAVEIAGNTYSESYLDSVTRIVSAARIIDGGNVAEMGDVTCRLVNNGLHTIFNTDDPTDRKATIKMSVISPNMILNSTFGKYTGSNFDDWTEFVYGGSFAADTTNKYDGANSLAITTGTPEPVIQSNVFQFYQGTQLHISFWMRGALAGDSVALYFCFNGLWFNFTTRIFGVSRAGGKNTFTVAAGATWERKTCMIDYAEFTGTLPSSKYASCVIQFESDGNNINIDAVQIERTNLTDYHHNRYELTDADMMIVYTGFVKQMKWDIRSVELVLEPWGSRHHREIPITILTANTDATWTVPDDNIGKPFPMTYGDFVLYCGDFWDSYMSINYNMAIGLLANIDGSATGGRQIYFDRPGMAMGAESAAAFYKNRLYHYDNKAGRYIEHAYDDRTTPLYCAREFVMDIPTNARFYEHASAHYLPANRLPLMLFCKGQSIETAASTIANDYMAFDGNILSYAQLTSLVSDFFHFYFQQFELDDTIWLPNGLYFIGDIEVNAATGGNGLIDFNLTRLNGAAWSLGWTNIITGGTGTKMFNTPVNRATGPPAATHKLTDFPITSTTMWRYVREVIDNMKMGIRMNASGISSGADLRVYECGLRMDYAVSLFKANPSARMYGRIFGGTWNGRKTASATIDEPIETLEGILRHELGAVDADINMPSFDTAHTRRYSSNGHTSYQLVEIEDSIDVFEDYCKQHGVLYWINADGKHSVAALGYYSPVRTLKRRDFADPINALFMERIPNDSVITGVFEKYDLNRHINEYSKSAYCDRNGSDGVTGGATFVAMCASHYAARGNKDNIINIEHDWSHYYSSDFIIRFLINWNQPNRIVVSGNLMMDNADLEIGDIVALDNITLADYIPPSILAASRFVVIESRIKRSEGTVGVKLLEVKPFS